MNTLPSTLRRAVVALVALTACVGGSLYAYHAYLRKVRLAFVGYQDVAWAALEEAARKTPYAVHRLERDALAKTDLGGYTGVFIWGMGLNLSPEQVAALDRARSEGTKTIVTNATNDASARQTSIDENQREAILAYLENGGEENLLGLLHYVARHWAGKEVDVPPLVKTPSDGYFYREGTLFETRQAFEKHVTEHGPRLPGDAPRVALIASFLHPKESFHRRPLEALIQSLEHRGLRVYPIFGREQTAALLEELRPDLAIAFPHGRLAPGNEMPALLASLDIPVLNGLSLGASAADWARSEQGMEGGRLSQSITMPELDGTIEPFALVSDELNERAIRVPQAIEDRVERFTARVKRWLELRRKPNAQKRIVIVYYKAPGLASLSAAGLEVGPSLWNTLRRLEQEGYDLGGAVPESPEALFELIQQKGKTLGQWAIGSYERFLEEAQPEFVPATQYSQWLKLRLSEKRCKEVVDLWGPVPGRSMTAQRSGEPCLVVSRIRLGNVVLMPQPTVGDEDSDEVQSIHGTDKAPPHFYLAAYLWARYGFQADAIVHFGTHGSLEFTRGKSAALSRDCWPDVLVGDLPHVYPYIINNVGEALVAKRRSYAVTVSHLTPPFMEASLYGELLTLQDKLQEFSTSEDPQLRLETRRAITALARQLDLGAELGLKEPFSERLLTDEEIEHLEDYIHELQEQTVTEGLHVVGRPWTEEQIRRTVTSMLGEPGYDAILAAAGQAEDAAAHSQRKVLARGLVDRTLDGTLKGDDRKPALSAVLDDIRRFADGLRHSPQIELDSIARALAGGYIAPSSGGDPLINPVSVPTGRNLYSINAEAAPTEEAWRVGCRVADEILAQHRTANGRWPRQVAVSLWGSEFVRDKGTTIAEVMYLLGVRPLRNSRGSVYDVEIIPSEELGRPRIDVLVQTSGQFRDAAASRIVLLDKAVQLVSSLGDEAHPNYVREGSQEVEMALKNRGSAPQEARELSTARIFGSAGNQSYGTGIMGMVEKGDTWQDEQQIADRYVRNMGGIYREGAWGTFKEGLLEAQLAGVEAVLHSRSSNTWGPLSLDHVYEFMGGITLSVRAKTGADPQGYFSDLRTRQRAKATTAVAAIREEARTTLWNPKFLSGLKQEGPSAAGTLAETVRNLYGWNVMQPSAIGEAMWNETYAVLVDDKHELGIRQFFEDKNPYALQDLTAVMLETARKGYWNPPDDILHKLTRTHAELIATYGAACSYETCGNEQLREFIAGQLNAPGSQIPVQVAAAYQAGLTSVLQSARPLPEVTGMELEESFELSAEPNPPRDRDSAVALAGGVILFVLATLAVGARRPRRRDRTSDAA